MNLGIQRSETEKEGQISAREMHLERHENLNTVMIRKLQTPCTTQIVMNEYIISYY